MAVISAAGVMKPVGAFVAMTLDTARAVGKRPFHWREFVQQIAFISGVSIVPAVMLTIPFVGFTIFILNTLLVEIGAIDYAGAAVGLAVIREIGPIASVLVVAGAGSTAICADLGARKIREEIDAMEVLGIDPIQRLVLPRVLASVVVAVGLNCVVCIVGVAVGYVFAVPVQGSSAGQFTASFTLLTGTTDFVLSQTKAAVFGLGAGLVGCFRGLSAAGGPKGVGDAVNQTVVLAFVVLFIFNTLLSLIFLQLGLLSS
ncbi:ABC transporter permease [Pseudonocardia sp.]|uniref:MlaE family ABC transporter permease n=1 Tax=Pseudonocardia sp. TaxID=60912 RepID=UPI00262B2FA8|nr:ABC transporter permease [Pseudonocardia sp.]